MALVAPFGARLAHARIGSLAAWSIASGHDVDLPAIRAHRAGSDTGQEPPRRRACAAGPPPRGGEQELDPRVGLQIEDRWRLGGHTLEHLAAVHPEACVTR